MASKSDDNDLGCVQYEGLPKLNQLCKDIGKSEETYMTRHVEIRQEWNKLVMTVRKASELLQTRIEHPELSFQHWIRWCDGNNDFNNSDGIYGETPNWGVLRKTDNYAKQYTARVAFRKMCVELADKITWDRGHDIVINQLADQLALPSKTIAKMKKDTLENVEKYLKDVRKTAKGGTMADVSDSLGEDKMGTNIIGREVNKLGNPRPFYDKLRQSRNYLIDMAKELYVQSSAGNLTTYTIEELEERYKSADSLFSNYEFSITEVVDANALEESSVRKNNTNGTILRIGWAAKALRIRLKTIQTMIEEAKIRVNVIINMLSSFKRNIQTKQKQEVLQEKQREERERQDRELAELLQKEEQDWEMAESLQRLSIDTKQGKVNDDLSSKSETTETDDFSAASQSAASSGSNKKKKKKKKKRRKIRKEKINRTMNFRMLIFWTQKS